MDTSKPPHNTYISAARPQRRVHGNTTILHQKQLKRKKKCWTDTLLLEEFIPSSELTFLGQRRARSKLGTSSSGTAVKTFLSYIVILNLSERNIARCKGRRKRGEAHGEERRWVVRESERGSDRNGSRKAGRYSHCQ